ncbi:MAG: hypothetical protein EOM70_05350 [Clostridia bacterium]|nr:hypothetical protein [Clostridia bacterium]
MTVHSIQPERTRVPVQHPASRVLAGVNMLASAGTVGYLWVRYGAAFSGRPLAQAGLFFAAGLSLINLAWLLLVFSGRKSRSARNTRVPGFSIRQALLRPQCLTAWLVFHSAVIPLLVLGPQSGSLQVPQFLAFLLAVLVMGLLPVGLMIWLDAYLARKLQD